MTRHYPKPNGTNYFHGYFDDDDVIVYAAQVLECFLVISLTDLWAMADAFESDPKEFVELDANTLYAFVAFVDRMVVSKDEEE